jgi:TrmH family RNA methyltransferase
MSIERCRVVLVRPEIAANIGAAARAMRNFGLRELVLVAPVADPLDREARRLSTHGETILASARIVATLDDAIADCVLAAATSARVGGLLRDADRPPEAVVERLLAAMVHGPVALVFGPEPSGLTSAEVARCHALLHLPTDPTYPALNLAQAVAICLYEFRRGWLRGLPPSEGAEPPASDAEREAMYRHLKSALERVHFLYGDKADALMHAVRRLIDRAGPTAMEVKLLHGLARQLEWFAGRQEL